MLFSRLVIFASIALVVPAPATAEDATPAFARDVLPILSENCFLCHGPDSGTREADLRLDVEGEAKRDLGGYAAIVPGDRDASEAFVRLMLPADDDDVMPPVKAHLEMAAEQIETIGRWIDAGAEYEAHWAYVAPERPGVPDPSDHPVDAFIGARLTEANIIPAGDAPAGKVLRRMALDLTGIPPTLAELDSFGRAFAKSPQAAVEAAADRLLASPAYGERMALAWLDIARYADTNGYQQDAYNSLWPYRDWVVRAFNANTPYDTFITQQLAGDLFESPAEDDLIATAFNRSHMLNGEGGTIPEENRTKYVFDRTETMATALLGMTANCAQCHDHKYDPFSQREYYQLYAFFNNVDETGTVNVSYGNRNDFPKEWYNSKFAIASPYIELADPGAMATRNAARAERESVWNEITGPMKTTFEPLLEAWQKAVLGGTHKGGGVPGNVTKVIRKAAAERSAHEKKILLESYLQSSKEAPPIRDRWLDAKRKADLADLQIVRMMVMRERSGEKRRETRLLVRGNYQSPGDPVEPMTPAALPPLGNPDGQHATRLDLARWLFRDDHPLTARVAVNRAWQHHFGIGLVKTAEDFGLQGEYPSHPKLLDWLAVELRESGWNLKHLHRLVVTSQTYRRDSAITDAASDPENRMLARGATFRVPSTVLRDQALSLSGLLVDERGGPPVFPYQPPGLWAELSFNKNRYNQGRGDDLYRKSLYTVWRRAAPPTSFFDTATRQVCAVKPQQTNTPLHALVMMNDPTYVEAARVWAQHLIADGGLGTDAARIATAFRHATGRPARTAELGALLELYFSAVGDYRSDADAAAALATTGETTAADGGDPASLAALTEVCSIILNLDETLTKR